MAGPWLFVRIPSSTWETHTSSPLTTPVSAGKAALCLLCLHEQPSAGCCCLHSSIGKKQEPISIFANPPKLLGPHIGFSQEISKCVPLPVFTGEDPLDFFSSACLSKGVNVVSPLYGDRASSFHGNGHRGAASSETEKQSTLCSSFLQ